MRYRNRALSAALLTGVLLSLGGCCPELRQIFQKEAVDAVPASGTNQHVYNFTCEECYDEGKQPTFALLWKAGKYKATVKINDLDVVMLPEQSCNMVDQAVEALGDAVGGAIQDAVGDLGCMFHLIQGPEFEHGDQVAIQDLRKNESVAWQVFKLGKNKVTTGDNKIEIVVENGTQQCTGDDQRQNPRLAYVLISDVDDPCDDKFK
ncbi:MAG: hypothetical protein JXR83_09175 [Deltaproteobacteria bacterium]|nr:hypothetical protein [Deltaproteobacteria bacterium]